MSSNSDKNLTNGIDDIKLVETNQLEDVDLENMDDKAIALLEGEIDSLSSELDKFENLSNSLHDKVADLLKETRQQNESIKQAKESGACTDEKEQQMNE